MTNGDMGEGGLKIAIFAVTSFLNDLISHLISNISHFIVSIFLDILNWLHNVTRSRKI